MRSKNLLFFGDSICHGQFISPHLAWIVRISEALHARNNNVTVLNPSHSGDTTRIALEKMPFDVQSHGVDTVYIQFGINDSNQWESDNGLSRVSPGAFEANLHEIIDRAKVFGARNIFLGTNHPIHKRTILKGQELYLHENSMNYNQLTRNVAKASGVKLIDNEKTFIDCIEGDKLEKEHFLLDDLVHLNEMGHDLYFKAIYPLIENILTRK